MVDRSIANELIEELKVVVENFYPNISPETKDYAHIATKGHFSRLTNIIDSTDGDIVIGGNQHAEASNYFIPPTIITHVKMSDSTMTQELFGPILPIVIIDSVDEAIDYVVNYHNSPLALYIFSNDKAEQEKSKTLAYFKIPS